MYQEKKNKVVSIIVHASAAVVLAIIMIILCLKNSNGEYYDLLINKALSKSVNGNWAKTSFAFIFSIIAEYPAYFILPIFTVVLFYSDDLLPKNRRKIFRIAMAFLGLIGWVILCLKSEVADKIQANGFDGIKFYLAMVILALSATSLGLNLGKYIPKKTRYILFKFAIFAITYLLVALLVTQVLKTIWHRMRFRDMLKENAIGHDGFSNFTPWFTPDMSRVELNEDYHYSSFPSGHSNSAVHIFILCTLYKILPSWREKKWLKYVIYGGCTAFVLLTMISRICDDAHFLSDVIAGASISYIIYKVVEYIYFKDGNNFAIADKALADLE